MPERTRFTSHEEYVAAAPADVQKVLVKVQAVVETAVPRAERCINYNIPAYRQGRVFFYFAAFKKHLGVYPPVSKDAALVRELSRYRNEKGNLTFKYTEPIPYELIGRVAVALAREHASR